MNITLEEIKKQEEYSRLFRIWEHPVYQEQFQKLQEAEQTREFCKHTLEHFLDVARIAWILNLEQGYGLSRELLYGAALMHDLGRYGELLEGTPHDEASAALCEQLLPSCGFSQQEVHTIVNAVLHHRSHKEQEAFDPFSACLRLADKLSRNCFACPSSSSCNWTEEKRNLKIYL